MANLRSSLTAIAVILLSSSTVGAQNNDAYTIDQLRGSARPYPAPSTVVQTPDSLTPLLINHVGRHGARYLSSSKKATLLSDLLKEAKQKRTITPRGSRLLALTERIIDVSSGRWGVLDTLGKAEQQGIAMRTYSQFPDLFRHGRINSISSYVPRCIMSMYEFTHQIARLDDKVEINTGSGRDYNQLMRFFSINKPYKEYADSRKTSQIVREYADSVLPQGLLPSLLGKGFPMEDVDRYDALMALYTVLAGTAAFEMPAKITDFMTTTEFHALWKVFNLRQYLTHAGNSVSMLPAEAAAPLLADIIATTDSVVAGADIAPVQLRFGHAETLMPFLSLIQLKGCSYYSDDLSSVDSHWLDFDIVPMAANFRLILFRSKSGHLYVRADLNEIPVALLPSQPEQIYVPWEDARAYLQLRLN